MQYLGKDHSTEHSFFEKVDVYLDIPAPTAKNMTKWGISAMRNVGLKYTIADVYVDHGK